MADPKFNPNAPYSGVQFDPNAAYDAADSGAPAPVGDTGAKMSANHPSGNVVQRYIDNLSTVLPGDRRGNSPLVNAAQDFGAGVIRSTAGVLAHPVETAKALAPQRDAQGNLTTTGKVETALGPMAAPIYNAARGVYETFKGKPLQEAIPDLAGQAVGGALTGEATNAAIKLAPRAVRSTVETVSGSGPRVTRDLVKETRAANATDAAKATESNRAAAAKHLDATQEALQQTREREDIYQAELKKAREEGEAAYQKKLMEVKQKRLKDESDYREAVRKYSEKKAKQESDQAAAKAKFESDRAAQSKIAPTAQKLRTEWGNLRAGIETAREKALKVGNEKYGTVREALNEFPANAEKLSGAYAQAVDSFGEAGHVPPLISRLEKVLKEPLTYADEQTIYSDLGKELSKGTLPGSTFHAYDMLQEAIGEDMQRSADAHGMGPELTEARNYWRRMKQTFGKPLAMRDAASGTLKSSAAGLAQEDALQNQIRLLGSFDPAIPKQFAHVQNIEKGVEALPKSVPERELTAKLVESRSAQPPPIPRRGEPTPLPTPSAGRIPAPPDRVAPPDRPTEVLPAPKKIGAEEVKAAKTESLGKRAERLRKSHSPIVSSIAAYDAIRSAIEGNWKRVGLDLAARGIYGAGKTGIAVALENPKVIDFLSNATPRDVAEIPPDLRGEFPNLVRAAQSNGIGVSPALKVMAISGPALAPRRHPSDEWSDPAQPQR